MTAVVQSFELTDLQTGGDFALAASDGETGSIEGGTSTPFAHSRNPSSEGYSYDAALAASIHEDAVEEWTRVQAEHEALAKMGPQLLQPALSARSQALLEAAFTKHLPRTLSKDMMLGENVSAERARLLERIAMYGMTEREVKGDGNCMFRALSDQLYRTPRLHAQVRRAGVKQLRSHPDWYSPYVMDQPFEDYCNENARLGVWGDHVILQAIADAYGCEIKVLTSYEHGCVVAIDPREKKSQSVQFLSFWAEVHYNSLYPEHDPPPPLQDKLLGSHRLHRFLQMGRAPAVVA